MSSRDTRYYLSCADADLARSLVGEIASCTGWEATNTNMGADDSNPQTEIEDLVAAQAVVVLVDGEPSAAQWVDMGIALGAELRVVLIHLEGEALPLHAELEDVCVVPWDAMLGDIIAAALESEEEDA